MKKSQLRKIIKELINEQSAGANWCAVKQCNPQPGEWGGTINQLNGLTIDGNPPQVGDFFRSMVKGSSWTSPSGQTFPPAPGNLYNEQDLGGQRYYNTTWEVVSVGPATSPVFAKTGAAQCCATYYEGICNGVAPVLGCMDANALNYDVNATIDDGSCDYGWRCKDTWPQKPGIMMKCVPGDTNNVGQFGTKQDCLSSGCEPLPADLDKEIGLGGTPPTPPTFPTLNSKMTEPTDDEMSRMKDLAFKRKR